MERIYIDRSAGTLERTDLCLVRLTLPDGTVHDELEPRRLFPYTAPDQYVSLLNAEGHEVAVVRDVAQLDRDSAKALSAVLSEYYMIPKIEKLLETEDINGAIKWRVLTDRGETEFRIRNRNSDIKRRRGTKQILVRDANDNRYLIPDYTTLDHRSRRLLYSFL